MPVNFVKQMKNFLIFFFFFLVVQQHSHLMVSLEAVDIAGLCLKVLCELSCDSQSLLSLKQQRIVVMVWFVTFQRMNLLILVAVLRLWYENDFSIKIYLEILRLLHKIYSLILKCYEGRRGVMGHRNKKIQGWFIRIYKLQPRQNLIRKRIIFFLTMTREIIKLSKHKGCQKLIKITTGSTQRLGKVTIGIKEIKLEIFFVTIAVAKGHKLLEFSIFKVIGGRNGSTKVRCIDEPGRFEKVFQQGIIFFTGVLRFLSPFSLMLALETLIIWRNILYGYVDDR